MNNMKKLSGEELFKVEGGGLASVVANAQPNFASVFATAKAQGGKYINFTLAKGKVLTTEHVSLAVGIAFSLNV